MEQNKMMEIKRKSAENYKRVYDSFEIDQRVELTTDSYQPDIEEGAEGVIVDKAFSEYGCDLRVDFLGYVTWIDAVDVR